MKGVIRSTDVQPPSHLPLMVSSGKSFEHLLAACDDALLRALHHPCRLRVAPKQPEELLVSRLGLAVKPVSARPVQVRLQVGGLPHEEAANLRPLLALDAIYGP